MSTTEDAAALYLNEQRQFRRLEASLPVWIGRENDLRGETQSGISPWSLGYTRDLSMGGAKIIVPPGEEPKWLATSREGSLCLLRFDVNEDGQADEEYIEARVRHAAHDRQNGTFWLGVEYDEGAQSTKANALRAGLRSKNRRRRWQMAFVLSLVLVGLAGWFIKDQRSELNKQEAVVAEAKKNRDEYRKQLSRLSRVGLVGTRAQGVALASQEREARENLAQANKRIARYTDEKNQAQGEEARRQQLKDDGLEVSSAPATGANVEMGIALPYGYAWPVVVNELEQTLNRRVPLIVVFRDFKAPFPIGDAREARVYAKTLQITWEPWHFSNPKAIKMQDIIAGKHDKYIDSWAQASKSFGAEIWIRFAHEFNGNWYPWSVSANGQNPQVYIKAFRHVRDRFRKAGAFNVRWIWCMNAESVPDASWNDPLRAYPGDDYVDMISIDGYNFGTAVPSSRWQSFNQVFGEPYAKVNRKFPNKPLMIGEIGCATVGGDKVAWMRDMDKQLRTKFKRVQSVVWFEAAKEADWRMLSSPDAAAWSRQMWTQRYYRRGES